MHPDFFMEKITRKSTPITNQGNGRVQKKKREQKHVSLWGGVEGGGGKPFFVSQKTEGVG